MRISTWIALRGTYIGALHRIVAHAAASHANSEFNLLKANLVVRTGCQFNFGDAARMLHQRAKWRHAMKTLITALAGMAVCAALAVFAGNADAHVSKKRIHAPKMALGLSSLPARDGIAPRLSSLTAKGGPLHDCVHVTFPQCSRGYDEPND
jgi:hypothetical protein